MEIRCEKCGKLLTIIKHGSKIIIEIKCTRCGHINLIKILNVEETQQIKVVKEHLECQK